MRRSAAVLAVVLRGAGDRRLRWQLGLELEPARSSGSAGRRSTTASPSRSRFWNPFTGRQLAVMNSVIADFHKLYPNDHGQEPGRDHRRQHRRGDSRRQPARPDDVAVRRQPRRVLRHRGVDQPRAVHQPRPRQHRALMPAAVRGYTQFNGDRCALPDLADAYGLYYNKALFAKAGITSPPKTFSRADRRTPKKLTQFNPDGSIKVAGFVPDQLVLRERRRPLRAAVERAVGRERQVVAGDRPALGRVHALGEAADRLLRGQQADALPVRRGRGVLAVERLRDRQDRDGARRRVARAVHQVRSRQASTTAPRPRRSIRLAAAAVRRRLHDGQRDRDPEGRGATRPRRGCWRSTSPSTPARSRSSPPGSATCRRSPRRCRIPTLTRNAQFDTFLKIFANPHTATDPITAIGSANQEMLQSFQSKWEDGSVPTSGLDVRR